MAGLHVCFVNQRLLLLGSPDCPMSLNDEEMLWTEVNCREISAAGDLPNHIPPPHPKSLLHFCIDLFFLSQFKLYQEVFKGLQPSVKVHKSTTVVFGKGIRAAGFCVLEVSGLAPLWDWFPDACFLWPWTLWSSCLWLSAERRLFLSGCFRFAYWLVSVGSGSSVEVFELWCGFLFRLWRQHEVKLARQILNFLFCLQSVCCSLF